MDQVSPQQRLTQLITSYWVSQAIYVAAKLGLADLVKDGPCTAEELARPTGTQAPALYRLLRALASVGIFAEDSQRRFTLTPMAEYLRSDTPASQRGLAVMNGEEHYRSFGDLLHSVRTGETAFDRIHGMPIFAYLTQHPEQARVFDEAMVGIHGRETAGMLQVHDFADIATLADIGGGNGSLLTAVLRKYPKMCGLLFDLPSVVERARGAIQAAGLADRCRIVGGSFFESVPPGADAYLLRHIIHDWDEAKCLTILRNIRGVIGPKGKLLVLESVIPPGNEPSFGKLLDLTMLVIPGGQERTEDEYRQLLAAAGFRLDRVTPTGTEISILEAVPA